MATLLHNPEIQLSPRQLYCPRQAPLGRLYTTNGPSVLNLDAAGAFAPWLTGNRIRNGNGARRLQAARH